MKFRSNDVRSKTGDIFIRQVLLIQIGSLPSFDTSTVDLTQRKTPGVVCATSFSILHVLANSTNMQSTCLIFYVFTFLVYTYAAGVSAAKAEIGNGFCLARYYLPIHIQTQKE